MTQEELTNKAISEWEAIKDQPRYKTQGFLGLAIDETTEMVTLPKQVFMELCFNLDRATGAESSFLYHHKLANDTEVQVAKSVYDELLKYE